MKRVGINLLWMVPGVVGGSETYTVRLLSGLAERASDLEYTLFALPQFGSAYPELAKTFETVYGPMRGKSKPTRVVAGEHAWLSLQVKKRNIDMVHHAGGVLPLIRPSRPVLTIHDLQYLFYPEYFTRHEARVPTHDDVALRRGCAADPYSERVLTPDRDRTAQHRSEHRPQRAARHLTA